MLFSSTYAASRSNARDIFRVSLVLENLVMRFSNSFYQESLNEVRSHLCGHFEDEIYGLAANIVGMLFCHTTFTFFM